MTSLEPVALDQEVEFMLETAGLYLQKKPTKRDVLEQDDIAYAALNDAKPGRVLVVTPGNVALEVALATQRAELAFETFVQIRNKVVSAYQAVMQMQV